MQYYSNLDGYSNVLSVDRVWAEIKQPKLMYNKYDFNLTVDFWDETSENIRSKNPKKEVLNIDLDGDGDLDQLYTSWFSNGRQGLTMEWYTIFENGKYYGWFDKTRYTDGGEMIKMSGGELFELHNFWKTIRMPVVDRAVYGLLSEGGYSHGYYGSELIYFEKSAKGGYERKSRLLMLTRTHGEPNNPPDIRTYDDGFKTLLNEEGSEGDKLYHEKIGQYILTPEGQDSYEVVSSFNVYEALKKAVAEKREKEAAAKKETLTIKQPVTRPAKQKIIETEKPQAAAKSKQPRDKGTNFIWFVLLGLAGVMAIIVIVRKLKR